MVIHPDYVVDGCGLKIVGNRSVPFDGDKDTKINDGVDNKLQWVVSFADADEKNADHAYGVRNSGDDDDINENSKKELFMQVWEMQFCKQCWNKFTIPL